MIPVNKSLSRPSNDVLRWRAMNERSPTRPSLFPSYWSNATGPSETEAKYRETRSIEIICGRIINTIIYADDKAVVVNSQKGLQQLMDNLNKIIAYILFILIYFTKTSVKKGTRRDQPRGPTPNFLQSAVSDFFLYVEN